METLEILKEMRDSMVRADQLKDHINQLAGTLENKMLVFEEGVKSTLDSVTTKVDQQLEQQRKEIQDLRLEMGSKQAISQTLDVADRNDTGGKKMFKNVPTYNGDLSWSVYQTQFEIIASVNNWSDKEKACALASSLRSPAVELLQTIPEAKRLDYGSLVTVLERRYGDLHRQPYFSLKLRTRMQGSGESLQSLASDVEKLSRLAYQQCPENIQDELAKQSFVDALSDPDMQQSVRMANCPTLQDSLVHAMNYEMAREASWRNSRTVRAATLHDNVVFTSQSPHRIRTGRRTTYRDRRRSFRCWHCDEIGHIAANCPQGELNNSDERLNVRRENDRTVQMRSLPNTSSRSGQGNEQGNPTPVSVVGVPPAAGHVNPQQTLIVPRVSYERCGTPMIEGLMNGVQGKLVVDTGANATFVRTDIYKRMKMSSDNNCQAGYSTSLTTVTGATAPVLGQIEVDFDVGGRIFKHTAYIADIMDDGIIGSDFLAIHNFVIDLQQGVLRCAGTEIPLCSWSSRSLDALRVVVEETVEIPARSELVIPGKLAATDPAWKCHVAVCEAPPTTAIPGGLLVRQLLVDVQGSSVPVAIANPADVPIKLKAGVEIASCELPCWMKQVQNGKDSMNTANTVRQVPGIPVHLIKVFENAVANRDATQTEAVKNLLTDFQCIFSASPDDYGRTNILEHQIDTGDAMPIRQRPRRLPLAQREEVEKLTREMSRNGVIEASNSPWASPVVLVKKKDGSMRFCVDYRRLNSVTKKDSYPIPRIDEAIDALAGSTIFSTLDLRSGYWQVGMSQKDSEKTAFVTANGLWQFTVMPFGLCNAPATFERLMETILRGLTWKTCLVYLDDVIVVGKDFEDHMRNLREVFLRFKEAGLKLNPNKCTLLDTQVEYLGHIVTQDGVITDPRKTEAVSRWPTPANVRELQSFLGLCSYYRRFVRGFSQIAAPLHRLTEKKAEFHWTAECEDAFNALKLALTSAPILAYPLPDLDFILDTDASNTAIGAVLSQVQDGQEKVVAYYSKSLAKAEQNYCTTRRELLAVVKAIGHFHPYLYGRRFQIRSDHSSLQWLLRFNNLEGQLARWVEKLQAYDFVITYRTGRAHANADSLSRRPCAGSCRHCLQVERNHVTSQLVVEETQSETPGGQLENCPGTLDAIVRVTTVEDRQHDSEEIGIWEAPALRNAQRADSDVAPVVAFKEAGRRPTWPEVAKYSPTTKHYWEQWDSLFLRDGILYRHWENASGTRTRWQLVVPRNLVKDALRQVHDSPTGGHFGVRKTLEKVRERFYWDKCQRDVAEWCHSCHACAAKKGPHHRTRAKLMLHNVGAPFERVGVDVLGPLPRTESGNRYLVIIMDYFSKWPEAIPTPNHEASTVADVLVNEWVSRFGVPLELHSDQGRDFESKVFQEVCQRLGVRKTRTTPLHPQSGGLVERFNRTLVESISHYVSENQKDWDCHVPLLLLAYRSAVHEATKETPATMIFGRDLRLPCDLALGRPNVAPCSRESYVQDLSLRLESVHQFVRERLNIAAERMKHNYDAHCVERAFEVGEHVWLYHPKRKKGRSPKLQKNWEGPYVVVKKLNDVLYRIRGGVRSRLQIVHVNRLAPYHTRSENK